MDQNPHTVVATNGTFVDGVGTANISQSLCPLPEPFVINMNSRSALLSSDGFNGTQLVHAGNYTCFVNGEPRATVEIDVLGKIE